LLADVVGAVGGLILREKQGKGEWTDLFFEGQQGRW